MTLKTTEEIGKEALDTLRDQFLDIIKFMKRRNDLAKKLKRNPKKIFKKLIDSNKKFTRENINLLLLIQEDYKYVTAGEVSKASRFLNGLSKVQTPEINLELHATIVTISAEIYYGTWYSHVSTKLGDQIREEATLKLQHAVTLWKDLQDYERALVTYDKFIDGLYSFERDFRLVAYNDYLDMSKKLNKKEKIASITKTLGDFYFEENEHNKSFEMLAQSLALYNDLNDNYQVASINKDMGDNYFTIKDYKNAEIVYKESLRIFNEKKMILQSGWVADALSRLYQETKSNIYDISDNIETHLLAELEPKQFWMCSLQTSVSNSGQRKDIDRLVEVYHDGKFKEEHRITDFFEEYLAKLEKSYHQDVLAHAYYSYARILEKKSLNFDSQIFLKKALFLAEKMDFYPLKVKIYKIIAINNLEQGKLDLSLDNFNRCLNLYKEYSYVPDYISLLFFENNSIKEIITKMSLDQEIDYLEKFDQYIQDPKYEVFKVFSGLLQASYHSIVGNTKKSNVLLDSIANLKSETNISKILKVLSKTTRFELNFAQNDLNSTVLYEFIDVLKCWENFTNKFEHDFRWIYRNRSGRKRGISLLKSSLEINKVFKFGEKGFNEYLAISRYYLLNGNINEAKKYAEQSLNHFNKNILGVNVKNKDLYEIYYQLGLIYFISRNIEMSLKYLKYYLEDIPDKQDDWNITSAIFMVCYLSIISGQDTVIEEYLSKIECITIEKN